MYSRFRPIQRQNDSGVVETVTDANQQEKPFTSRPTSRIQNSFPITDHIQFDIFINWTTKDPWNAEKESRIANLSNTLSPEQCHPRHWNTSIASSADIISTKDKGFSDIRLLSMMHRSGKRGVIMDRMGWMRMRMSMAGGLPISTSC